MIKCVLNKTIKKIIDEDKRRVYIIYEGNLWYPIILSEREKYKRIGYEVYALNIQYELDSMVAEEVLQYCTFNLIIQ